MDVFTLLTTSSYQASARTILENRGAVFLQIVGRLKRESLKAANAELNAIVESVAAEHPETRSEGQIAAIQTLPDHIAGTNRTLIYLLFSGSVILLLVASINLASLLATRVSGRSAEIAVRAALGAGKKRLLRQFLTEGLILSVIGASAGELCLSSNSRNRASGAAANSASCIGLDKRLGSLSQLPVSSSRHCSLA